MRRVQGAKPPKNNSVLASGEHEKSFERAGTLSIPLPLGSDHIIYYFNIEILLF